MSNMAPRLSVSFGLAAGLSMIFSGAFAALVGCVPTELLNSQENSVAPDSSEITFENYRDRQILIDVPPGNHNPEINWSNLNSAKNMPPATYRDLGNYSADGLRAYLEGRYQKVIRSIAKDPKTFQEIRKAGELYGIDPTLILGNIVGEHVYNVGVTDSVQSYVAQKLAWGAQWAMKFSSNGVNLVDLLKETPFGKCDAVKADSHAVYWECVADVYNSTYMGRTIGDRQFGSKNFKFTFFNPFVVGMTYGLGQLDPIRALMVTDRVNHVSGFRLLTIERPAEIYEDIIDPRVAVHYIAANITYSIEAYKKRANFDISRNPGVVATMYNLGKERYYSTKRYNENIQALKAGRGVEIPRESYYGFFINEKEQDIRRFLQTGQP